jgi:hypothetical protein
LSSDGPGVSLPAQVYAEFAGMLHTQEPLGRVAETVADMACRSVPGVEQASITMIERGRAVTVGFSGNLAVPLDERQYADGFGPCLRAASTGGVVEIADTSRPTDFVDFAGVANRFGIRRVVSVGMVHAQEPRAGLNL